MLLACLRYKYVAGMQAMCARTLLQLVPDAQMVAWFTWDGRNPCGDLQLEDFVVVPKIEVLLRLRILFGSQAWKRSIQCKRGVPLPPSLLHKPTVHCCRLFDGSLDDRLNHVKGAQACYFHWQELTCFFFHFCISYRIWCQFVQSTGGGMTLS